MTKIYLSSTFKDLQDHRARAYAQLRRSRYDVISMEDYNAGSGRPLDKCLADVREADIYLLLVAWRYGFVPRDDNPDGLSITELEYRQAVASGKKIIAFLANPEAAWPVAYLDSHTGDGEGGALVKRFRAQLEDSHTRGTFTTPENLAASITPAIEEARTKASQDAPSRLGEPPVGTQAQSTAPVPHLPPYQTIETLIALTKCSAGIVKVLNRARLMRATGVLLNGRQLHRNLPDAFVLVTPWHALSDAPHEGKLAIAGMRVQVSLLCDDLFDSDVIQLGEVLWASPIGELDVVITSLARQPDLPLDELPLSTEWSPKAPVSSNTGSALNDQLFVIGHPYGGPKVVSPSIDRANMRKPALEYTAMTAPGSSGSAVLNSDLHLVGLHRLRNEDGLCEAVLFSAIIEQLRFTL